MRTIVFSGVLAAVVAGGGTAGFSGEAEPPAATQSPKAVPRPDWVDAHMEEMLGTWIADNSAYRSAAEPYEAYGIEWKWGLGKQSLVGRLFALKGSREAGVIWEFREFWHPGEGRLLAAQYGSDGTFGIGPEERTAGGGMELLQTFYDPAGPTYRVGHRSERKGDERVTRSFDVAEDGTWRDRRTYVWRRQAVP